MNLIFRAICGLTIGYGLAEISTFLLLALGWNAAIVSFIFFVAAYGLVKILTSTDTKGE